jgi:hypothetical protein
MLLIFLKTFFLILQTVSFRLQGKSTELYLKCCTEQI